LRPKPLSKAQIRRLRFRNSRLQESSVITYGYAVRSYYKYLLEHGYTDEFDIYHIREWLHTHDNANTFNNRLQGIKEFYYKQVEHQPAVQRLKVREAFESIKRMRPEQAKLPGRDYLNYDQVMRLAGSTTDRCSCYILALFWTGCRISELVNIKLTHCTPGDPVFIRVIGKGMEEGTVFMPQSLYNRIRTVFGGSIYLFETKDHRRANRQTVSEEIKRQAGRKEHIYATAHIFRHSKAMYLKERGISIDQIAKALRHKRPTTTLAYYQHGSPSPKEQGIV
jgi:integrase